MEALFAAQPRSKLAKVEVPPAQLPTLPPINLLGVTILPPLTYATVPGEVSEEGEVVRFRFLALKVPEQVMVIVQDCCEEGDELEVSCTFASPSRPFVSTETQTFVSPQSGYFTGPMGPFVLVTVEVKYTEIVDELPAGFSVTCISWYPDL